MDAWADGLNFYLATHPDVKPRVITKFEPWMALSFSEGSIGGDIERVNLTQLEAFYGAPTRRRTTAARRTRRCDAAVEPPSSRPDRTASRSRASNTASGKALLLINPHTSFFFREEAQMVSEEGLNAYGALTWGQFFIYQGFNDKAGWMHTSSSVDNIDEYLETVTQEGRRQLHLSRRHRRAAARSRRRSSCRTSRRPAWRSGSSRPTARIAGRSCAQADGKWVSVRLMEEPVKALTQSYSRTKARNLAEYKKVMDAAHQLVEQHALRRRRRQHRLLPLELHSEARSEVRLDQAGRRQQSGDRVERRALVRRIARTSSIRRTAGSTTPTTIRSRRRAPATARSRRRSRRTSMPAARTRAASTRSRCSTGKKGLHARHADHGRGVRQLPAGVRDPDSAAAQGARRRAGVESAEGEDR